MPERSQPTARRAVAVVLADDHAMVRSGLRLLLEREDGVEVVGESADVDAALAATATHRPDVLLLDLSMPGSISSMAAIAQVMQTSPRTRVIVLTMQSDPAFARAALQAGAVGYLLKDADGDALVEAIRRAGVGGRYVDPAVGAALAVDRGPRSAGLTSREMDVVRLIALGHTNGEIAQLLGLSIRTIESHRTHIQRKLGRPTRAELVRFAIERRLLGA